MLYFSFLQLIFILFFFSDPDWLIAKRKEEEDLDKAVKLSLKESQVCSIFT